MWLLFIIRLDLCPNTMNARKENRPDFLCLFCLIDYSIHHSFYHLSTSTWVIFNTLPLRFFLIVCVYIWVFRYHLRGFVYDIWHSTYYPVTKTKRLVIISKRAVRLFQKYFNVSSLIDVLHILKYVEIRKSHVLNNIIFDFVVSEVIEIWRKFIKVFMALQKLLTNSLKHV